MDRETIREQRDATFDELRKTESMEGNEEGTVSMKGERFNIMGADYFMADILDMLSDTYGRGAGGILKETGVKYGKDLLDILEPSDDFEKGFGSLLGLLKFLGYSSPKIEGDKIIIPSSPTAVEYINKGYEQRRTCYFLTGILSGAAEKLGHDGRFIEEQCRANGHDNCIFILKGD